MKLAVEDGFIIALLKIANPAEERARKFCEGMECEAVGDYCPAV
jgi:hypothetical protein